MYPSLPPPFSDTKNKAPLPFQERGVDSFSSIHIFPAPAASFGVNVIFKTIPMPSASL